MVSDLLQVVPTSLISSVHNKVDDGIRLALQVVPTSLISSVRNKVDDGIRLVTSCSNKSDIV